MQCKNVGFVLEEVLVAFPVYNKAKDRPCWFSEPSLTTSSHIILSEFGCSNLRHSWCSGWSMVPESGHFWWTSLSNFDAVVLPVSAALSSGSSEIHSSSQDISWPQREKETCPTSGLRLTKACFQPCSCHWLSGLEQITQTFLTLFFLQM